MAVLQKFRIRWKEHVKNDSYAYERELMAENILGRMMASSPITYKQIIFDEVSKFRTRTKDLH
jgi:hypothetical protein